MVVVGFGVGWVTGGSGVAGLWRLVAAEMGGLGDRVEEVVTGTWVDSSTVASVAAAGLAAGAELCDPLQAIAGTALVTRTTANAP